MSRPAVEVADILHAQGDTFLKQLGARSVPENGQQQALGGDEFAGLARIEDSARLFLRDA